MSYQSFIEHIPSPILSDRYANDSLPNQLRAKICSKDVIDTSSESSARTFSFAVIYLHGFPDMSVHPTSSAYASRLPAKLCEHIMTTLPGKGLFVCFNLSGLPGSNSSLSFEQKTVSQEVRINNSVFYNYHIERWVWKLLITKTVHKLLYTR